MQNCSIVESMQSNQYTFVFYHLAPCCHFSCLPVRPCCTTTCRFHRNQDQVGVEYNQFVFAWSGVGPASIEACHISSDRTTHATQPVSSRSGFTGPHGGINQSPLPRSVGARELTGNQGQLLFCFVFSFVRVFLSGQQ